MIVLKKVLVASRVVLRNNGCHSRRAKLGGTLSDGAFGSVAKVSLPSAMHLTQVRCMDSFVVVNVAMLREGLYHHRRAPSVKTEGARHLLVSDGERCVVAICWLPSGLRNRAMHDSGDTLYELRQCECPSDTMSSLHCRPRVAILGAFIFTNEEEGCIVMVV